MNYMVKIENLKFNNKNKFKWEQLEKELMSFVGNEVVIDLNKKTVIFDKRTTDEMSFSNYNYKLQGKMKLVKANACMYYKELLKEAINERHQEDFNKKHGNLALKGFDRYDTFFEYPDRDASGNIKGFTKYKATIVVRLASDDKFYLYDIIDIKKEISDPHRMPKGISGIKPIS